MSYSLYDTIFINTNNLITSTFRDDIVVLENTKETGTTDKDCRLVIRSNEDGESDIHLENLNGSTRSGWRIMNYTQGEYFSIGYRVGYTTSVSDYNFGWNEYLTIKIDGNVGIGTDNPVKKLDVRGDIFNTGVFLNNASQSAASPSYSFYFDSDTGMFRATADELGFSTGGTERVRIDSNGYVGIGTNNPLYDLDVNGKVKVENGLVFSSLYNSVLSTTTPVNNAITNSSELPSGKWYRIAVNGSVPLTQTGGVANDGSRCSARFTVMENIGFHNSTRTFYAGSTMGGRPFINLLSNTTFTTNNGAISRVRIIEDGQVDGLAIEIYVDYSLVIGRVKVVMDDNYQYKGFTLVDFAVAPNSYDNYIERELSFDNIVWGNFYDLGTNKTICMDISGDVGIGTDSPSNTLQVAGGITCTSLTQTSDDRLKINEKYITNATDTLLKLKPQVYDKLTDVGGDVSDSKKSAGLIAQEVYVHAPELRYIVDVPEEFKEDLDNYTNLYNEDPTIDPDYSGWSTSNVMGIDYQSLTPYLIKAVQEKHEELQETKAELQETKAELQSTKIELNNIKEFLKQKYPGEL
jgi:hypothetical protein